ncbi:hypothetical protein [Aquabacterium sp.]|uniref:hypothetical protein n=1 Tax=Aquabacterium sp. TaxID=1872578 RepID=UPI002489BBB0|nr:hypothetical protein [Aquabacterium sp.]MDI1260861.1 hypothetical protein [Aquabacterium sp.]
MAITLDQIEEAGQILGSSATVRAAAALIRERFAPLPALVLDAFDMRSESPALQVQNRALFLMATDGHCWSVTGQLERASAFVLTQD